MASILLLFLLVFIVIPWQVAFLGCWIIHFFTCATYSALPRPASSSTTPPRAITPPSPTRANAYPPQAPDSPAALAPAAPVSAAQILINTHHQCTHILLLMTWLLPPVAPVLAVWVRTLATTALTTPFNGDHSFLTVAPFLVLVDFASWTRGPLLQRRPYVLSSILSRRWKQSLNRFWLLPDRAEKVSLRWLMMPVAALAFLTGPRWTYDVFDSVWALISALVMARIGFRYFGYTS